MKRDYDKMLKAFEKKHGNLADWRVRCGSKDEIAQARDGDILNEAVE